VWVIGLKRFILGYRPQNQCFQAIRVAPRFVVTSPILSVADNFTASPVFRKPIPHPYGEEI
jgi:hypothetical protein